MGVKIWVSKMAFPAFYEVNTFFFGGGILSCVKDFDELMLYWVLLHAMQKLYIVLQK